MDRMLECARGLVMLSGMVPTMDRICDPLLKLLQKIFQWGWMQES